jgi:hypothetical protein
MAEVHGCAIFDWTLPPEATEDFVRLFESVRRFRWAVTLDGKWILYDTGQPMARNHVKCCVRWEIMNLWPLTTRAFASMVAADFMREVERGVRDFVARGKWEQTAEVDIVDPLLH